METSKCLVENKAAAEIADKLFGDGPEFSAETSVEIVKLILKRCEVQRTQFLEQQKRYGEIIDGILKNLKEI